MSRVLMPGLIVLLILMIVACVSEIATEQALMNTIPSEQAINSERPDLLILNSSNGYRPECLPGGFMSIDTFVKNDGMLVAPTFEYTINGTPYIVDATVMPGDYVRIFTVDDAGLIPNSGSHYTIELDPDNKLLEANEDNNSLSSFIMTTTPPGPCATIPYDPRTEAVQLLMTSTPDKANDE